MTAVERKAAESFVIICVRCDRPLGARREWVGRDVQCPHCAGVLRVPPVPADGRPVRAQPPMLIAKRQFNFGCPRCQTLLEAHTGLCGQPGCCPTCGARLVVPELRPDTGMPRATALLDTDDQDPTPMHAYAASGAQAPRIRRLADGTQVIECPRCGTQCDVDANSCRSCGAPFTLDAAPTATSASSESWAVTSIVLGVVSLPLFFLFVPAVLAVVFGFKSLRLGTGEHPARGGVVGIILGILSFGAGLLLVLL